MGSERQPATWQHAWSEGIANSSPFAFPANQCAWPASPPHFSSQSQFEKVRRGGENVTDLSPLQCNTSVLLREIERILSLKYCGLADVMQIFCTTKMFAIN